MTQVIANRGDDWPTIWEASRAKLCRDLGTAVFNAWLGKLILLSWQNGEIRFGAPKPFVRNWIQNNYSSRLEKALRAEGGNPKSISIVVAEKDAPVIGGGLAHEPAAAEPPRANVTEFRKPAAKADENRPGAAQPVLFRAPDPTHTFAGFITGTANALAVKAAKNIAEGDADEVRVLYIHGTFGLGKTHLLNAIVLACRQRGLRALVLGAEDFMRQFLGALNRRETLSFKEELRAADVLLIDDLQHLCRSTTSISELLHTLNAYSDFRRKLVIAADRPPAALEGVGADVRSRLSGGLVVGLEKPERATRLEILKARAQEYAKKNPQIAIPGEALDRLADLEDATPRDLIGLFNNLTLHAELTKNPAALHIAVENIVKRGKVVKKTSIEDIQKKIADFYKLDPRDFQSQQRSRRVARPRQVAMFLAREITARSLPEIGRRFGGRDHTTVLHACRRIAALCTEDPSFKEEIDFLKRILGMEK
ncbi:MAG TPA: chromosomal replication initiator protein DnaA [Rhizomicrobium sp.]|jgi:chromosomal replication initiator protein|nr:chromosomal replication initiator protein DnaA [Rhizomicrobium sp.]